MSDKIVKQSSRKKSIKKFILLMFIIFRWSVSLVSLYLIWTFWRVHKKHPELGLAYRSLFRESISNFNKNIRSIRGFNKNITSVRGGYLNMSNIVASKNNKIRNDRLKFFAIGTLGGGLSLLGLLYITNSGLSYRELQQLAIAYKPFIRVYEKFLYFMVATTLGVTLGTIAGLPVVNISFSLLLIIELMFGQIQPIGLKNNIEQFSNYVINQLLLSTKVKQSGVIDSPININRSRMNRLGLMNMNSNSQRYQKMIDKEYEFFTLPYSPKQKLSNPILDADYSYNLDFRAPDYTSDEAYYDKPDFRELGYTSDEPSYIPNPKLGPTKVESEKSLSPVVKSYKYNRSVHTLNDLKKEKNQIESEELNYLNNVITEKNNVIREK